MDASSLIIDLYENGSNFLLFPAIVFLTTFKFKHIPLILIKVSATIKLIRICYLIKSVELILLWLWMRSAL